MLHPRQPLLLPVSVANLKRSATAIEVPLRVQCLNALVRLHLLRKLDERSSHRSASVLLADDEDLIDHTEPGEHRLEISLIPRIRNLADKEFHPNSSLLPWIAMPTVSTVPSMLLLIRITACGIAHISLSLPSLPLKLWIGG
jgi:hypothetical protein